MDDDEVQERVEKLGFRPQKENIYNKLLPYADKLDEESTKLFNEIKTNLIKSVLAREMRPGCALWTSRLNKYMKIYGFKFPKEDHIALIRLYYELLTIPSLEPTRIQKSASTLSHLLKKRYLLSQDDLQLEWRPLYDLCVRVVENSKTDIGMYKYFATLEHSLNNLILHARIYFPANATKEILEEFRPKLCPFNSTEITTAVEYLSQFLPVCVKPEDAGISYELWHKEFMDLWEISYTSCFWENNMAWLMARLSCYNVGRIDWEPYIPIMFVRFSRTLNLPVGYRKRQSGKQYKIDISAMAMWIACVLGPESETAFFHLQKFMQTLETYYHPANSGSWSIKIRELLRKLAYYFVQRVHCERYKEKSWEIPIPDNYKLRDEDITRFVNIMKPCVEQAIYTLQGAGEVQQAMQYLASLRPEIIVPIALDKLYLSMDSLTEPHKLTTTMMCVLVVSRYMVQGANYNYPEGPTHVIPLLTSLLPGIDTNDLFKTFVTFRFLIRLISMCPLVDSSEASKYYTDLTEEEHIICEASAGLEDFVLQFFDRLHTWIDMNAIEFTRHEQVTQEQNKKTRMEYSAEHIITATVAHILPQSSPSIFSAALRKMYKFATEHVFEAKVSGKLVALMCQCFAKVNPKETLRVFVPYLCDTIERLIAENEDILKEEHPDDELLYNLQILAEIVDGQAELVHYMDRLNRILKQALHMTSTVGSEFAAHMLEVMMSSLTFTRPTEHRSCSKPYDTPIQEFLTIRSWGVSEKLEDLNISWYIPGENEIKCVQELVNRYLIPELETLTKYAEGEITVSREYLRRSLRIIISILAGQTVFPIWEEPALQLVESKLKPLAFNLIAGGPHTVSMPDGRNIRKTIADVIHNVQKKILAVDEGDTKSVKNIVTIYSIILFNKFPGRDFEMDWKVYHNNKKLIEDRLLQHKMHMRHFLIERVLLQQMFRNEGRSCTFTETHRQILLDLFELGVGRYSEVRILAQAKLFTAVSNFPYSYTVLTQQLKEILQTNSVENHEKFKGALHVLLGPKSSPIIARHDWNFLRDIWPLVVKSMPSEKPSVINLINSLADSIHRHFHTIAIKLVIPKHCLDVAYDLGKKAGMCFDDFQEVVDTGEERLKLASEEKEKTYKELISLLLDACVNRNLHWLHHLMALGCIRDLVHYDVMYDHNVVRYFLRALINDSLAVRKHALRVTLFIMVQNKPKFKKVAIDPLSFSDCSGNGKKIIPGVRADNKWLLYNSKTVPRSVEDWDTLRYVHDQHSGYYDWPKELKVYDHYTNQPTAAKRMDKLTPQEKEIFDFFSNKDNLKQLVRYLSMEEKKGRDQFNCYRFLMFKTLFKLFEDKLLDEFLPHLQQLVADKEEHSQRCAAEMISGIIRGSKHWSFEQTSRLWEKLLPLFRTALNNMSVETLADWTLCVTMSLESRDPNRHHWFLEFLMEDPLSEQTSFLTCGRLLLLQMGLNQQTWRNAELNYRLLNYLKNHLSHSFQNVREKISSCLMVIFSRDLAFPGSVQSYLPRVENLFGVVMPKLDELYEGCLRKLQSNGVDGHIGALESDAEKDSIRLFKTVSRYATASVIRVNYSVEHFKLLPLTCILQSNDTDDELGNLCTNLLATVAHSMIHSSCITEIFSVVRKVILCPFWSARAVIADFMPVLVFHNMATIVSKKELVEEVENIALILLKDPQPEVRIKASTFVSGLLHCQFILSPMDLLAHFKQLARTKLKKKAENNTNLLSLRHAGVLGLCAFINAHPYDVPDYLPGIFGQLGPHQADPQPIPATIRKTLQDFKRTHHDNWQVHKLKFTEDELSVLSDLTVPLSYFA